MMRRLKNFLDNPFYRGAGILLCRKAPDGQWLVLLGKRSGKLRTGLQRHLSGAGKWSIFGGGVNKGETYVAGAMREAAEEGNIVIPQAQAKALAKQEVLWIRAILYSWSTYLVVTDHADIQRYRTAKDAWEFSELRWFPMDALPRDTHCFMRRTVRNARRALSSSL